MLKYKSKDNARDHADLFDRLRKLEAACAAQSAPVTGAVSSGGNASATVGGDCSRCQLMIEHIRAITGRG